MQTAYYSIIIENSPTKVYELMLDHDSYRKWTKPFSPTSDLRGDWTEKSKMLFTSKDKDGFEAGMIAVVDANIPGEIVVIRHVGMFDQNGEYNEGKMVDEWKNSLEVYRFKNLNGKTNLICSVELSDQTDPHMFDQTWPEALNLLKEICEK